MDFNKIWNSAKDSISQNSPEILAGLGISGFIFTAISAAKATPKALDLMLDYRYEHDLGRSDYIPNIEIVKTCWRVYAPSVIMGIASTAMILAGTTTSRRRNAAIASALAVSKKYIETYQEKVIESLGEKKEGLIRDEVYKDRIVTITEDSSIIDTGNGDTLFYDYWSHQVFKSSREAIERAEIEFNRFLVNEGQMCLNDFYDLLGIDRIPLADYVGINAHDFALRCDISSTARMYNDKAVIVLKYDLSPNYTRYF